MASQHLINFFRSSNLVSLKAAEEIAETFSPKMIKKGEYLFNVANDQTEKNNLKDSNKAMTDKLKKMLADWESSVLKPIPL